MNLFDKIEVIRRSDSKAALCIIVDTKGSTPRKVGSKMIVREDGSIAGTIGGGDFEKKVIENALNQIRKNETGIFKHDLLHQHNMCCGGTVWVYIEPVMKKNRLYIFGAGHTGVALAKFAMGMDFDIYLIDDRKEYLDVVNEEEIDKMHVDFSSALPSLPFDDHTYITIMTYDHAHDRDILAYCMKQPHAYLGMIGSLRKVEMTKKIFLESNLAKKEELVNIDMPMGTDINAESPEEIAVSILAKLIEYKNRKS